jgi:hypothetical protein
MRRFKNIAAERFGKLIAVRPLATIADKNRHTVWECTCDCGNTVNISISNLTSGNSTSCGCKSRSIGGWYNTPEYGSFMGAKKRCTNSNSKDYKNYGGRGINFCFGSFTEFINHIGPKPEPKNLYSLDRFPDNNGNYCINNVRWATAQEQIDNQREVKNLQAFTDNDLLIELARRGLQAKIND